jgi:hypothetical protein
MCWYSRSVCFNRNGTGVFTCETGGGKQEGQELLSRCVCVCGGGGVMQHVLQKEQDRGLDLRGATERCNKKKCVWLGKRVGEGAGEQVCAEFVGVEVLPRSVCFNRNGTGVFRGWWVGGLVCVEHMSVWAGRGGAARSVCFRRKGHGCLPQEGTGKGAGNTGPGGGGGNTGKQGKVEG